MRRFGRPRRESRIALVQQNRHGDQARRESHPSFTVLQSQLPRWTNNRRAGIPRVRVRPCLSRPRLNLADPSHSASAHVSLGPDFRGLELMRRFRPCPLTPGQFNCWPARMSRIRRREGKAIAAPTRIAPGIPSAVHPPPRPWPCTLTMPPRRLHGIRIPDLLNVRTGRTIQVDQVCMDVHTYLYCRHLIISH